MRETDLNKKRIRDNAPYRKTITMSETDLKKAEELERMYGTIYPDDAPFNFSKTMSKAIEVAYASVLNNMERAHVEALKAKELTSGQLQVKPTGQLQGSAGKLPGLTGVGKKSKREEQIEKSRQLREKQHQ